MKASSSGNRHSGADNMANAIREMMNLAKAQAGLTIDGEINETINIDDSQIEKTGKKLKNLKKEAGKGIDIPINTNIEKEIDEQINGAKKRIKKSEIEVPNEDLHKSPIVNSRIEKLYGEL